MVDALALSCSNPFPCTHLLNILKSIIRVYKLPNILLHLQYFVALAAIAVVSIHVQSVLELLEVAILHLLVLVDEVIVFWVLPYVLSTYAVFLHLDEELLVCKHIGFYEVLLTHLLGYFGLVCSILLGLVVRISDNDGVIPTRMMRYDFHLLRSWLKAFTLHLFLRIVRNHTFTFLCCTLEHILVHDLILILYTAFLCHYLTWIWSWLLIFIDRIYRIWIIVDCCSFNI